jgi:hypothetical protein
MEYRDFSMKAWRSELDLPLSLALAFFIPKAHAWKQMTMDLIRFCSAGLRGQRVSVCCYNPHKGNLKISSSNT